MFDYLSIRREFHKYAEFSWHEIRTSARIGEILSSIGYTPLMGLDAVDPSILSDGLRVSDTARHSDCLRAIEQGACSQWVEKTGGYPGVVAVLDTGKKGPVFAFRFDIDALPYPESCDPNHPPVRLGYASVTGAVHACGHDGHTATGLGFAELVMQHKHELCGTIRLLFQPAEEAYGGAESMVSRGHLDDVDYFVSQHIALSGAHKPLPSHTLACGCDDFLSYRRYDVKFKGHSAHPCGASQLGKNAILAACMATLGIHSIAQHEDGLFRTNVGRISGGVASNTIAPEASIQLEYRGETDDIDEYAKRRVEDVLDGACRMHNCTYEIHDFGSTLTAKSDRPLMNVVAAAAKGNHWFSGHIFPVGNVGGSDDATVMIRHVQKHGGQGTYFGLGADITAEVHNEAFDFDESCMLASAELCLNIIKQLIS